MSTIGDGYHGIFCLYNRTRKDVFYERVSIQSIRNRIAKTAVCTRRVWRGDDRFLVYHLLCKRTYEARGRLREHAGCTATVHDTTSRPDSASNRETLDALPLLRRSRRAATDEHDSLATAAKLTQPVGQRGHRSSRPVRRRERGGETCIGLYVSLVTATAVVRDHVFARCYRVRGTTPSLTRVTKVLVIKRYRKTVFGPFQTTGRVIRLRSE